jgi:hypothetical protein
MSSTTTVNGNLSIEHACAAAALRPSSSVGSAMIDQPDSSIVQPSVEWASRM